MKAAISHIAILTLTLI